MKQVKLEPVPRPWDDCPAGQGIRAEHPHVPPAAAELPHQAPSEDIEYRVLGLQTTARKLNSSQDDDFCNEFAEVKVEQECPTQKVLKRIPLAATLPSTSATVHSTEVKTPKSIQNTAPRPRSNSVGSGASGRGESTYVGQGNVRTKGSKKAFVEKTPAQNMLRNRDNPPPPHPTSLTKVQVKGKDVEPEPEKTQVTEKGQDQVENMDEDELPDYNSDEESNTRIKGGLIVQSTLGTEDFGLHDWMIEGGYKESKVEKGVYLNTGEDEEVESEEDIQVYDKETVSMEDEESSQTADESKTEEKEVETEMAMEAAKSTGSQKSVDSRPESVASSGYCSRAPSALSRRDSADQPGSSQRQPESSKAGSGSEPTKGNGKTKTSTPPPPTQTPPAQKKKKSPKKKKSKK